MLFSVNYFPCANSLLVNTFAFVLLEQYPLSGCVINRQAVYVCSVVISSCYQLLSSCYTRPITSAAHTHDMTALWYGAAQTVILSKQVRTVVAGRQRDAQTIEVLGAYTLLR